MKGEVSTLRPPILRDGWKESFRPDKGEASLVGKSEGGGDCLGRGTCEGEAVSFSVINKSGIEIVGSCRSW